MKELINDFIKAIDFIKGKSNSSFKLYEYSKVKEAYYFRIYNSKFKEIISKLVEISKEADEENKFRILKLIEELKALHEKKDYDAIKRVLLDNYDLFEIKKEIEWIDGVIKKINRNKIPREISGEIFYDLEEIVKCYKAKAYRAVVVLCSRLLELALHRKYYEATGIDLLEKAPGIGLGNLIAKLREKGIEIDPAITQQIHLINQIRIFSVHKKKYFFNPSQEQVQAIILYTVDLINKLFN